jgi:hypothetical protein
MDLIRTGHAASIPLDRWETIVFTMELNPEKDFVGFAGSHPEVNCHG